MRRPRVAVTALHSNQVHGLRFDGYAVAAAVLQAIAAAGGEPLSLFPGPGGPTDSAPHGPSQRTGPEPTPWQERLEGFDALVIPGGWDLDPACYGQAADPTTQVADFPDQDPFETAVLLAALDLGLPTLAICRGAQLLNVALGGTLIQDIAATHPGHKAVHPVTVAPDSNLAAAVGAPRIDVSSYHHQAIARLGEGLVVTARADDGIVEAIELDSNHPVLGVQWHPEDRAATDPTSATLFTWLLNRTAILV